MSAASKKPLVLVVIAAVGLLLAQYYAGRFRNQRGELISVPAPNFETESLDGQKFILKDLIGEKVLLVNFWATWCAPCRDEMPVLNALQKEFGGGRFQIVSLMEDDLGSPEEMRAALERFKKKIPVDFPVYRDDDGMIADLYGTYKIPESYVIDMKGYVAAHHVGALTEYDRPSLSQRIRAYMGAEPIKPKVPETTPR